MTKKKKSSKKKKNVLAMDRTITNLREENRLLKRKYKDALSEIRKREGEIDVSKADKIDTVRITAKKDNGVKEATAFFVASDWHVDETVKPFMVSGLNKYNQSVVERRARNFFRNAVVLYDINSRDVEINTIVLALLGDFISSNIHDELLENNSMLPMDGIIFAQTLIASGIEYMLEHTSANIIIQCHSGNHSRITKRVHNSTEAGNSLEFFMYHNLEQHFMENDRVTFNISRGYHSFLRVYGKLVRFHHGHSIRYYGGVGGIYIPVNKAIAQWNKMKSVSLDVFAHFHQFRDGGNFICNGSLIGYSAYALSIKADFEKPKQAFFLIDKKRWKTIVAPVFLD